MLLITRFNKLIRNRILWTVFAVIVVVSFVGAGAISGANCRSDERRPGVVGRMFGEDVSNREFLLTRYFETGMREPSNLGPEGQRALRRRTWKRLAALRAAREIGVDVSNAEVLDLITQDQAFAPDGAFDRNRYRAIVQGQLGIDEPTFEAYLRQDVILKKLMYVLDGTVWTAPYELDYRLDELTDEYSIEYVVLERDRATEEVALNEEEVAAFFEEYKDLFTVPETVRVRYMSFPISNYTADVTITEDDVLNYYTSREDEFTEPGTNDTPVRIPLEDVRDRIVQQLEWQFAAFTARDDATRLVMRLAPDRYGNAATLEGAADEFSLTISTTEFFSIDADVPGLAVDRSFNESAFGLQAQDPESYFSDAIMGSNAVFVIAAGERRPSRVPELEEVVDEVRPLAERRQALEAFMTRCQDVKQHVADALSGGTSFRGAVEEFDLNVNTTRTFSVYSSLSEEIEYGDALIPGIRGLAEGDLTEILDVEEGALLGYVKARQHGDVATKVLLRPEIVSSLDRYRAAGMFDEWTEHLLASRDFEDYFPMDSEDDALPASTDDETEFE